MSSENESSSLCKTQWNYCMLFANSLYLNKYFSRSLHFPNTAVYTSFLKRGRVVYVVIWVISDSYYLLSGNFLQKICRRFFFFFNSHLPLLTEASQKPAYTDRHTFKHTTYRSIILYFIRLLVKCRPHLCNTLEQ